MLYLVQIKFYLFKITRECGLDFSTGRTFMTLDNDPFTVDLAHCLSERRVYIFHIVFFMSLHLVQHSYQKEFW